MLRIYAVATSVIIFLISTIAWADQTDKLAQTDGFAARYAPYPCIANAISTDFGKAEIVALGNSAFKRAINTTQLKEAIGLEVDVLDISKNWRGPELNFTILKEYLERHQPELLILELMRGAGKKRRYHPNTHILLPLEDLSDLVLSDDNLGTIDERKAVLSNLHMERLKSFNEFQSDGQKKNERKLKRMRLDTKDCTPIREGYKRDKIAAKLEKIGNNWWNRSRKWNLKDTILSEDIADRYNFKMVDLANQYEIPMVFVSVGRMGEGPLEKEFHAELKARYKVPVYSMDEAHIEEVVKADGFRDITHFALPGSAIMADFLTEKLESDGFLEALK